MCFVLNVNIFSNKYKYLLTQHILTDLQTKYKCNQNECNQTFKRISHLIRYKSTHSSIKKFICDWNQCGKSYETNKALK